jgi:hypothetical protein
MCFVFRKSIQVELNSTEKEYTLKGQPLRAWLSKIALDLASISITRIHAVTKELILYYKRVYSNTEFIYNPNFIVDEYYYKNTSDNDEATNILFMGDTNQEWQGVDLFIKRVVVGNAWFQEKCRLHIAGQTSEAIKAIAIEHGLKEMVISHGYVTGKKKQELVNDMHIGIGVFNLVRAKEMKEATPIKTSEFLYSGLPVIIGYIDNRLSDDLPFVLRIDINQDISELQVAVNNFVKVIEKNRSLHNDAHEFALQNMTVSRYVQKILN